MRVSCVIGMFALIATACDQRALPVSKFATAEETYALTASWPTFAQGIDRGAHAKLDVLFMVDNSSSMEPLQRKLVQSFAAFTGVIEALPGGAPDLHIGVVSSDMGAGATGAPGCNTTGGDRGLLQFVPKDPVRCQGFELADSYIALHRDPATGSVVTNYGAQSLSDAFVCIASLNQGGCGFEHQFSSVRHALDPALAPPENATFLRPEAYLAVVMVTNEDDCSAPLDSNIFNADSKYLSDPLGPLTSFRCNYVGHVCDDGNKSGPPSLTKTGALTSCRSAEDGRLDKVSDFVAFLKGLKSDPARVFFAAVTGPATPYGVALTEMPNNDDPASRWPEIQHSCTAADGTYADPSVRITEAVTAFGTHGALASICGDSMAPALHDISTSLVAPMQESCVSVPANGPGCTVVDRWADQAGQAQAARLKSCADTAGAPPCWHLDDDVTCGTTRKHLVVDRGDAVIPAHLFTAVQCAVEVP
ncbi:MAG: hypothetical protein JWM82_2552 [Myxococcales bacterium]|nr:hypothetical protein [Myxococcales bacterium]